MPYKDPTGNARWYQENKDDVALYYADYRDKIRSEMVAAYGGKCSFCGEDDAIVLVLDHVNDDGQQERKKNGHEGGFKLYAQLRREGWPKDRGLQLLCHNCNYRKEHLRRKRGVAQRHPRSEIPVDPDQFLEELLNAE